MSDSPKLKKIIGLFFFFYSYYLHSVSLPKSSTLLHTNFRVFSRRHRIHFSFHRFPSCSSLHTRSCGLKKKVRNKQQNQKFFRNGSCTATSLFALFKQTLPLFSQLQFAWFKDTRPCGLKGNEERNQKFSECLKPCAPQLLCLHCSTVPQNAANLTVSFKCDPHVLKSSTKSRGTTFPFKLTYVTSSVSNYYPIVKNNFSTNFHYTYILHFWIIVII